MSVIETTAAYSVPRATRSSTRKGKSAIKVPNERKRNTKIIIIDDSSDSEDDVPLKNSKNGTQSSKSATTMHKPVAKSLPNPKVIKTDSEEATNINSVSKISIESAKMVNVTPHKQKSRISEQELSEYSPVTPPKQRRTSLESKILSPSYLMNHLNLNSPPPKIEKLAPKSLFEPNTQYQSARKALHSTVPTQMPGREKEHEELRCFIKGHLKEKTSGTLYVSGPPGTGKTASLSMILQEPDIASEFKEVYVNCTAIKSSGSIYSRIVRELNLKSSGRTEKDYLSTIESYLTRNHKMILLVLDELDQLECKSQSILYSIFEWPARSNSKLLLIGIANALDLTDRVLPRLQARCELKPKLMHFAPYSKPQIVQIFTERLKQAGVLDVFSPVALQMLAGKVAAISGDVRRALDIGRRVVELVEQNRKQENLEDVENKPPAAKSVDLKQVVNVLNNIYGTSQILNEDADDAFPLQQKIILCSLLLILRKARNKDVTIGKLHEVYRKVCSKRSLVGVDQSEFVGLCSLIETRGILRISGKKEPRLHKVNLQWNEEEVGAALKDKKLMSTILQDDTCLGKL